MEDEWSIFTKTDKLTLYQSYAGEIRFGPVYLNLKSEPLLVGLSDKIFGDWFAFYKNGILLQEWNSLKHPDTNLLFISVANEYVEILVENIPSIFWEFKVENGSEKLLYQVAKNKSDYVKYEVNLS